MLQCPSLEALVAEVVAAQVDVCNALIDTKDIGEGLAELARGNGQVDSRLVGISLQLLRYALSIGSSACPAQACTRDMPRLSTCAQHDSCQVLKTMCMVICFHLVSAVYPKVTHSISSFDVNIVRNFIPLPEKG